MTITADKVWYLQRDGRTKLSPHCPIAENDKCPRYYVSQQYAAAANLASLDLTDEVRTRIEKKWATSDVVTSYDLTVGSSIAKDGTLRGIVGFCPEVSARIFDLYCSSLSKFPDEEAQRSTHKILAANNVAKTDLRWQWMMVEPRHYTDCHEFSVYSQDTLPATKKTKKRTLSPKLRFSVLARDGWRCVYCGEASDASSLHIDHKISIADGGSDLIENLVTACQSCNLGKGAMSIHTPPKPTSSW